MKKISTSIFFFSRPCRKRRYSLCHPATWSRMGPINWTEGRRIWNRKWRQTTEAPEI